MSPVASPARAESEQGQKSGSCDVLGRKTQEARANPKAMAILQAAKSLFLEHGFGDVSMDQIARLASVSKATVYAHFTSKENLFAEMVFRACIAHGSDDFPVLAADSDVESKIEEIVRIVVDHLLSPEPLSVYRIIMAEGPRFPELPKAFFGNGPLPMIRKLSDFFTEANRFGLLNVPNTRLAAEQAIWLVRGPLGIRRMMDMNVPADFPSEEAVIKGAAQMLYRTFKPKT